MQQPLEDISVLELSTMIAGPYAGQMLGDLGADVVKIERPEKGELARSVEPTVGDESFYYLTANRNKRSLALDVTDETGREILLDLVEQADVFLSNFSATFVERYDIDYERVSERNPELIYCLISAYGASGPYRESPGIDTTVQALSGAMSMTRTEETPPMRAGVPMNDIFAAQHAVSGIMTALFARERGASGEFIDISLLDSGIAALATRATYSLVSGEPYPPFGRRHNYFAPEGAYEVADGDVQLSVVTDRHWRRFCEAIDEPELAAREQFVEVNRRVQNRETLDEYLEDVLAEWSADELVDSLREHGVPAGKVNTTRSVWDHPQVKARNMRRELTHPQAGTVDTLGFPVKYEQIEQSIDRHPPLLGEHTSDILRAKGYSETEIQQLREKAIVDDGESK